VLERGYPRAALL